jgi:FSR family fosmidomycin resistance protein-like MFS transporter
MDRRAMGLLSLAHLADDVNQSFLPALLPFLIAHRGLDYTSAATLIFAANASSSVVQPAIGWLADRKPLPWIIPAGLLFAGGGVALVGVAPTYGLMLIAALLSGLGVAAFHPEAARLANFVAGDRKATGMRWFAAGGNAGFAIGPLFASFAVVSFGLRGSLFALFPVCAMALVFTLELPRLRGFVPKSRSVADVAKRDDWPAFARLSAFVVFRAMTFIGLVAFVPLYFVNVLHASAQAASIALTVLLGCGVLGTLAGGPAADRYGRRTLLIWSTGASAVLIFAFIAATANVTSPAIWTISFAGVAVIGFALVASQASYVVLAQEYLPNRMGVASGVTLGLAVSLGGVASPVLGAIGDAHGLRATLTAIGVLCVLAFVAALLVAVPELRPRNVKERARLQQSH